MRKVHSVKRAYLRSRFKGGAWPNAIDDGVAFTSDAATRTTTQAGVFAIITLYFGSCATTVALLEFEPSVAMPLMARMMLAVATMAHMWQTYLVFGMVAVLAVYVATCLLYAARLLPASLRLAHAAMLLLVHAPVVGVVLAGVDTIVSISGGGSRHPALYATTLITATFAIVAAMAAMTPLDDPRGTRVASSLRPWIVALASWTSSSILIITIHLSVGSFRSRPETTTTGSIVEIAIALGVAALVVGIVVAYDAVPLLRRIARHEWLHGATYLLVDLLCVLTAVVCVCVTVAVAAFVMVAAMLGMAQGGVLIGRCGSCGGCGGGVRVCAGCCHVCDGGDACYVATSISSQCCDWTSPQTEQRAETGRCWRCVSRTMELLRGAVVVVYCSLQNLFCCCLVEELHDDRGLGNPTAVGKSIQQNTLSGSSKIAPSASLLGPIQNQVMQR